MSTLPYHTRAMIADRDPRQLEDLLVPGPEIKVIRLTVDFQHQRLVLIAIDAKQFTVEIQNYLVYR